MRVSLLCLALSCFGVLSTAHAQEAATASDPRRDAEARSMFEAGRSAYDDGRYQDALAAFQRAYELSHRSALLYNIGQCHDRLRHDQEAVDAFEAYLAENPAAENSAAVRPRIDALRGAIAERETARAPTPEETARAGDTAPDDPAAPRDDDGGSVFGEWWFWTIVGVVVAGGVVATLALTAETNHQPYLTGDVGAEGSGVLYALEAE